MCSRRCEELALSSSSTKLATALEQHSYQHSAIAQPLAPSPQPLPMSERFYSPHPITAGCMMLDGPEAHHLLHVMRASVGDEVTLFDDSGAEFKATVETLRRADAELRIIERREIDRELPFELVVGVALPKGDRQKWLVEKLTELGVTTLVPLITERCVAQPAAAVLDRLRRSVIEAAKQCGRNRLMKIAEPKTWTDWISENFGLRISDCELNEQ